MVGEGDSVLDYNSVRRCGVGTAFHVARPCFPSAEGRAPDGRLAGHHRPREGSKERCTWVKTNDEYHSENGRPQHAAHGRVTGGEQDEGMCLLRGGLFVEMELDDRPFGTTQASLRVNSKQPLLGCS